MLVYFFLQIRNFVVQNTDSPTLYHVATYPVAGCFRCKCFLQHLSQIDFLFFRSLVFLALCRVLCPFLQCLSHCSDWPLSVTFIAHFQLPIALKSSQQPQRAQRQVKIMLHDVFQDPFFTWAHIAWLSGATYGMPDAMSFLHFHPHRRLFVRPRLVHSSSILQCLSGIRETQLVSK